MRRYQKYPLAEDAQESHEKPNFERPIRLTSGSQEAHGNYKVRKWPDYNNIKANRFNQVETQIRRMKNSAQPPKPCDKENGSSGISWGFFIGSVEGTGKTEELLEWNL
jgi:hypothetical protein